MSVQALSAVFDLPGPVVSPAERLVLLSIANHANRYGGESYPGWSTIVDETGLSKATVARAISRLRGVGMVSATRHARKGDGGRFEMTVYQLHVPGIPTPEPESHNETRTESHGETAPSLKPSLKPSLIDDNRNHIEPKEPREPAPTTCGEGLHVFTAVGARAYCGACRLSVPVELAEMSA